MQEKSIKMFFVITSWMIFRIVISSTYSETFSSMMTIPMLTPLITSFQELVKAEAEGRVQVFADKNSLYYQILKVLNILLILRERSFKKDFYFSVKTLC